MTGAPTRGTEHHPLGVMAALCAPLCWSAGNMMVREIALTALWLTFWRTTAGAVVYSGFLVARGRRLRWVDLKACIPVGIVAAFWYAAFFEALNSTTIANVTMAGALLPAVLFAVAARRYGEPITLWLLTMTGLALGGMALVQYGSSSVPTWSARGDVFALITLTLWAVSFVMTKEARSKVGAVEFQTAVWIVGAVVMAPVAVISTGEIVLPSGVTWAWVMAMLLVPGTGHLLMTWAHRHVKLTVASMVTLAVAPLSMVGGAIFHDEFIVWEQVLGGVVVLGALTVVIRRDAQLARAATPSPETGQARGLRRARRSPQVHLPEGTGEPLA